MTLQQPKMDIYEKFWYQEAPFGTFYLLGTRSVLWSLFCLISWHLGKWTEATDRHLYPVLPPGLREFVLEWDQTWTHNSVVPDLMLLLERKEEVLPIPERLCVNR